MTDSFHLIGIGGAGMSAVARLLLESGNHVSGSDQSESNITAELRRLGATVHIGHQPGNVPEEATVVVSSAINRSNPEIKVAEARKQKIIHRSEALAAAAQHQEFIAVAGAHGKTTTSAMIAEMLHFAQKHPSFAVGSVVSSLGTSAHIGSGKYFVAEADESDGSFLNYRPDIAVVTNVEADHLDTYGSEAAFRDVFVRFAGKIRDGGYLVACADDEGAAELVATTRAQLPTLRVITYGLTGDVRLADLRQEADSIEGRVRWGDHFATIRLAVPGFHNMLNATAAWVVGVLCGLTGSEAAAGLEHFKGTDRRFQLRGSVNGRRVFDDYAHHPTEVAALMKQARIVAGTGKVIALFQPHLYSRTQTFARRFAAALSGADQVFLADIYGAREEPVPGISSALIADLVPEAHYLAGRSVQEAAAEAAGHVGDGDILLLIGAGSITNGANAAVEVWNE